MTHHRRRRIPSVVQPVDVSDLQLCEVSIRDLETAEVDAVHLADWRVVADAEGAHAAAAAEVMLVLPAAEEILRQLAFAGEEPESLRPRDRGPEPGAPANGAVAAEGRLREVEVGLEAHGTAMAGT